MTANITGDLGEILYEKNYRIVTSAGAVALEEEHNFIFRYDPRAIIIFIDSAPGHVYGISLY